MTQIVGQHRNHPRFNQLIMLVHPGLAARWRFVAICIVIAISGAIIWTNDDISHHASAYLPDMPTTFLTSRCSATCADDPFAKHGMMYWGNEAKETRWVPFPPSADSPIRRTKDIDAKGSGAWETDVEVLKYASPAYTLAVKEQDEETMGWARGKVVLFIGKFFAASLKLDALPTLNYLHAQVLGKLIVPVVLQDGLITHPSHCSRGESLGWTVVSETRGAKGDRL
jgi:hypothetical protein